MLDVSSFVCVLHVDERWSLATLLVLIFAKKRSAYFACLYFHNLGAILFS